jgi:DNA primase
VRVATLPRGDDPDSFIRRDGAEAFRARLDAARDFLDWQIDLRLPSVNPDNIRDRMKLLSDVTAGIAKIRDRMAQDTAVNRAAVRLSAPVAELRNMVAAHARSMLRNLEAAADRSRLAAGDAGGDGAPLEIANPAVRQLLKLAMTCSEARAWMNSREEPLPLAPFPGGELVTRALAADIDPARPESVAAWLATLAPGEESLVTAVMHDRAKVAGSGDAERAALTLKLSVVTARIDTLTVEQRRPGLPISAALEILAQLPSLQKEKVDLQKRVQDIQPTR